MSPRSLGLSLVVVVLAAAPAVRGTEPTCRVEGDLGKIQGVWRAQAGPAGAIRVELRLEGDKAFVTLKGPRGIDFDAEGSIAIDETASPKTLDWSGFTGPDGSELPVLAAIYRIEGDRLVVCNGSLHGSRPRDFQRGEGVLADVVTFHRVDTLASAESTEAKDR